MRLANSLVRVHLAVIVVVAVALQSSAAENYRFTRVAPTPGTVVAQQVRHASDFNVSIVQQDRVLSKSRRVLETDQQRRITVMRVEQGRIDAASIAFDKAERVSPAAPEAQPQAVQGKTYFITRLDDRIVISGRDGRTPPDVELTVVRAAVEAIVKPSPLAKFLDGRTVDVGQTLHLPPAIVSDLFSVDGVIGSAGRMAVTLSEVRRIDGADCAVFDAQLDTRSSLGSNLKMQLAGKMIVQLDTLHTVSVNLAGDAQLTSAEPTHPQAALVTGQGRISISMSATYKAPAPTTQTAGR